VKAIANIDRLRAESRLVAGPDVSRAAPTFSAASSWAHIAAEGAKIIATDSTKFRIDKLAGMTPDRMNSRPKR
jgi:hypothetical protein